MQKSVFFSDLNSNLHAFELHFMLYLNEAELLSSLVNITTG